MPDEHAAEEVPPEFHLNQGTDGCEWHPSGPLLQETVPPYVEERAVAASWHSVASAMMRQLLAAQSAPEAKTWNSWNVSDNRRSRAATWEPAQICRSSAAIATYASGAACVICSEEAVRSAPRGLSTSTSTDDSPQSPLLTP